MDWSKRRDGLGIESCLLFAELAELIVGQLSDLYPHQVLAPLEAVMGKGVISKYPLEPTGESLPGNWKGEPQILRLDWKGQEVRLVNFHAHKSTPGSFEFVDTTFRKREKNARYLAEFASQAVQEGPVLASGDFNTTSLSTAYETVVGVLVDSWREAGNGLGHTFPVSNAKGIYITWKQGLPVPQHLVRIDYVFHSGHWVTVEAHLAENKGGSDHRGVVVELVLVEY